MQLFGCQERLLQRMKTKILMMKIMMTMKKKQMIQDLKVTVPYRGKFRRGKFRRGKVTKIAQVTNNFPPTKKFQRTI